MHLSRRWYLTTFYIKERIMAEELVGFFVVLAFFMLLYSHLALDDFVARTVLTGDRATAPLGHGSVK